MARRGDHPETTHGYSTGRSLFRVMMVRPHQKGSPGNPDHIFMWRWAWLPRLIRCYRYPHLLVHESLLSFLLGGVPLDRC